jgi:hypothetical protein
MEFGINRYLGRPSNSRQVTPGQQVMPGQLPAASAAQQSIRKSVAAAQREGKILKNSLYRAAIRARLEIYVLKV